MAEWKHLRCGTVYPGKTPPFNCPLCTSHSSRGWRYLGPTTPSRKINSRRKAKIGPERRKRLYARDGNRCVVCGSEENLTLDHVRPRSKGGTNEDDNLQTMCESCNQKKGSRIRGS